MILSGLSGVALLSLVKDMFGTRYIGNMTQALVITDAMWLQAWVIIGAVFFVGLALLIEPKKADAARNENIS